MGIDLEKITIRHELRSGDLGYLVYRHGVLYAAEYQYGIQFESYVASGLYEFYKNFDPSRDRMWICEDNRKFVGSLTLMHRPHNAAQLRYFLIEPEYRGIGLGKKLMELYMEFLHKSGYASSYLWTTNELAAAASLYMRYGFTLGEEKESTSFGKPLIEQRYDLRVDTTA
jgi:ribosomal protein S18 acetylase RimI-like enzyme